MSSSRTTFGWLTLAFICLVWATPASGPSFASNAPSNSNAVDVGPRSIGTSTVTATLLSSSLDELLRAPAPASHRPVHSPHAPLRDPPSSRLGSDQALPALAKVKANKSRELGRLERVVNIVTAYAHFTTINPFPRPFPERSLGLMNRLPDDHLPSRASSIWLMRSGLVPPLLSPTYTLPQHLPPSRTSAAPKPPRPTATYASGNANGFELFNFKLADIMRWIEFLDATVFPLVTGLLVGFMLTLAKGLPTRRGYQVVVSIQSIAHITLPGQPRRLVLHRTFIREYYGYDPRIGKVMPIVERGTRAKVELDVEERYPEAYKLGAIVELDTTMAVYYCRSIRNRYNGCGVVAGPWEIVHGCRADLAPSALDGEPTGEEMWGWDWTRRAAVGGEMHEKFLDVQKHWERQD